jgi:hypothetical protein
MRVEHRNKLLKLGLSLKSVNQEQHVVSVEDVGDFGLVRKRPASLHNSNERGLQHRLNLVTAVFETVYEPLLQPFEGLVKR